MAKKQTEMVASKPEQLPAYLQTSAPVGVESKGETEVTPRIKVVQKMSDDELIEGFGVGAAILGDQQALVCEKDKSFTCVPLYKFPSWEIWKDTNDKTGGNNPVLESTMDPTDEIARLAKNRHTEQYGDGLTKTWVESFNVIIEIQDGPCAGDVSMVSFAKGSAKYGRRLNSYLRRSGADIFAHRITLTSFEDTNSKNQKYYVLVPSPAKPAYVDEETHQRLAEAYSALDQAYAQTSPPRS